MYRSEAIKVEANFGSTNQNLSKLHMYSYGTQDVPLKWHPPEVVCTVYVESVDGRKYQATRILSNEKVLGCPEARKGPRRLPFLTGVSILSPLKHSTCAQNRGTVAACLSWMFLSNIGIIKTPRTFKIEHRQVICLTRQLRFRERKLIHRYVHRPIPYDSIADDALETLIGMLNDPYLPCIH